MAIENHADPHPINSENRVKSSAASSLPVNHFNNLPANNLHLGATVFRLQQVNEFMKEMGDFQGNQFPVKYLHFYQDYGKHFYLHKFGKHVLILNLEIEDRGE